METKDFIKVIIMERKAQKLSQQVMADRLGITLSMYSKIETDQRGVTLGRVLEICEILNIVLTMVRPLHNSFSAKEINTDGANNPRKVNTMGATFASKGGPKRKNHTEKPKPRWDSSKYANIKTTTRYVNEEHVWIEDKLNEVLRGYSVVEVAEELLSSNDLKVWKEEKKKLGDVEALKEIVLNDPNRYIEGIKVFLLA